MRSSLATAEDICGALHWERVRAHWFERQGNHRMASWCADLARGYQQRLVLTGGEADG